MYKNIFTKSRYSWMTARIVSSGVIVCSMDEVSKSTKPEKTTTPNVAIVPCMNKVGRKSPTKPSMSNAATPANTNVPKK